MNKLPEFRLQSAKDPQVEKVHKILKEANQVLGSKPHRRPPTGPSGKRKVVSKNSGKFKSHQSFENFLDQAKKKASNPDQIGIRKSTVNKRNDGLTDINVLTQSQEL